MLVSEAVINCLVDNGIDVLFGIPGKQTLPLNKAIEERDDIECIVARHETAVSHQAWGYAETSGDPAATVTIPGPGDMNAMNGLKNALNDCTPLLHLSVETEPELRGGDGIHETPPDTYDNVVKENILVETPESTLAEVQRAIAIAMTPPKGPVRVGIPKNFLTMDVSLGQPGTYNREFLESVSEPKVREASELLAAATDPVIIAGGGVRAAEASAQLREIAEQLDAPIVTTYKGKGVVSEEHPLVAGALSGSASQELLDLIAESDAALGVGTDFDAVATRSWSVDIPETLIHITLHSADLGTGYEPDVGLVSDAAETLDALQAELADREIRSQSGTERVEYVTETKAERLDELRTDESPFTSVSVLETLRETIPRDAAIAVDAGGFRVWALNVFEAYGPRSYVNPGSWATMGTGLPSGIGAQLANPDDDVVVLTGDGGLMMCVHELHTAAENDLPITVVVLNNNDYAIISEAAERSYGLEACEYGWNGTPIDFVGLAESMGMESHYAATLDDVQHRLSAAIESDEPTLIEVPTDPVEPQASEWMSD